MMAIFDNLLRYRVMQSRRNQHMDYIWFCPAQQVGQITGAEVDVPLISQTIRAVLIRIANADHVDIGAFAQNLQMVIGDETGTDKCGSHRACGTSSLLHLALLAKDCWINSECQRVPRLAKTIRPQMSFPAGNHPLPQVANDVRVRRPMLRG